MYSSISVGTTDSNKCFDTTALQNSGAGWNGVNLKMKDVLKFVNWHIAAIKSADSGVLATVGSWNEKPQTSACSGCYNYYSDSCLTAAGGKSNGKMDFYQIHTYTWQGKYSEYSAMLKTAADYKLDKPIVVGEFATACSESKDAAKNYQHIYNSGFAGALNWQYNEGGDCSDTRAQADQGMKAISSLTTNGAIKITL